MATDNNPHWLVLITRDDRPFLVNMPFDTRNAATEAWGGLADGFGFKRMDTVKAATLSAAQAKLSTVAEGKRLSKLPRKAK